MLGLDAAPAPTHSWTGISAQSASGDLIGHVAYEFPLTAAVTDEPPKQSLSLKPATDSAPQSSAGASTDTPETALAASSLAICSGVRLQPPPPGCAQLLLVARADNHGRHRRPLQSQFSAICGTLLPVSLATSSSASTTV